MFHHDKEVPWLRIEGPALEQAKELEQIFLRDLGGENPEIEDMDPPSELVAWLCAHCLDLPSQSSPREFYDVKAHIQTEFVFYYLTPAKSVANTRPLMKTQ